MIAGVLGYLTYVYDSYFSARFDCQSARGSDRQRNHDSGFVQLCADRGVHF